ncbi:MDR family MFS transporter [Streptomyces sp. NPDC059982]|uniref:MDR family MFS transporter n=1 Tax=unclassified Streptomyces TaxID=2593676 RepID=UPI00367B009A
MSDPRGGAGGPRSELPAAYWWLWTSILVNRLGGFVVPFLALYLTTERGFSAAYAGLVAALYGLGGSVAAVAGGVLADRLGRRTTLLAASLGAAATTATLGFVTQPLVIAVVAGAVGLTANASRPAVSAMMVDLVRPEQRVRAYSLNYWAINVGFAVSGAVAGLIAERTYLWLFLGDALMTALCAVVVFARVPETGPVAHGPVEGGSRTGIGQVWRDRRFMALVGLTFLLGSVLQQAFTTLPIDMSEAGLTASDYGRVLALNGLLVVVVQLPASRWAAGREPVARLSFGALLLGWGFGVTAVAGGDGRAGTLWLYAASVAVWTLGEIVHEPASMAAAAELSPQRARGRYQGVYTLAASASAFCGPAAGGAVLDRYGSTAVWGACAVVGTVTAAGYWLLLRHGKGAMAEAGLGAADGPDDVGRTLGGRLANDGNHSDV